MARNTLAARSASVTVESNRERAALLHRAEAAKARFDAAWSVDGEQRLGLISALRNASRNGRQRYEGILSQIELEYRMRIDALVTLEDADRLGQILAESIVMAAVSGWARTEGEIRNRYLHLLSPLAREINALQMVGQPETSEKRPRIAHNLADDWIEWLHSGPRDGGELPPTLTREAISVLAVVGVIAPPIAAAGGAVTAIWSIVRRFYVSRRHQVLAAQRELREYAAEIFLQARRYYLGDGDSGHSGLVDVYLESLEQRVVAALDEVAARKSREAQAEMVAMVEQGTLDQHRRRDEAERLKRWLSEWDALERAMGALAVEIRDVDRVLAISPVASSLIT